MKEGSRRGPLHRWTRRLVIVLPVVLVVTALLIYNADFRVHVPGESDWLHADVELVVGEGLLERRTKLEPNPDHWHRTDYFLAQGSERVDIRAGGQILGEFLAGTLPRELSLPQQLRIVKEPIADFVPLNQAPTSAAEDAQVQFRIHGDEGESYRVLVLGEHGSSAAGLRLKGDHADCSFDLRQGHYLAVLIPDDEDSTELRRSLAFFQLAGPTPVGPIGMRATAFEDAGVVFNLSAIPAEDRDGAVATIPWPRRLAPAGWPACFPHEGQDSRTTSADSVTLSYALEPDLAVVAYPRLGKLWCGPVDYSEGEGRVTVTPGLEAALVLEGRAGLDEAELEGARLVLENRPFDLSPAFDRQVETSEHQLRFDEEGRLRIADLPAGPYHIRIMKGEKTLAETRRILLSGQDERWNGRTVE